MVIIIHVYDIDYNYLFIFDFRTFQYECFFFHFCQVFLYVVVNNNSTWHFFESQFNDQTQVYLISIACSVAIIKENIIKLHII